MSVTVTNLIYNRATQKYHGKITVTNNGADILAPVVVALNGLTCGVTLANAAGSYNGLPFATVANTGLAAGASTTIPVSLSGPSNAKISFTPVTYGHRPGSPLLPLPFLREAEGGRGAPQPEPAGPVSESKRGETRCSE